MSKLDINKEIEARLEAIQHTHGVRVPFAIESGSRAWGFASKDSDYDVRFIYVRPLKEYLTLEPPRDTIEHTDKELNLDFAGWDIRKALLLLRKGNPSFSEWLRSPIAYVDRFDFRERLRKLDDLHPNRITQVFHYMSMAQSNYREYLRGETVWTKKYFYVLRPILASLWVLRKQTFPPVEFQKLVDELIDDAELKSVIDKLIEYKAAGEELRSGPRIDVIHNYIEQNLTTITPAKDYIRPVIGIAELDEEFRYFAFGMFGEEYSL